jgi:hypothetical protein
VEDIASCQHGDYLKPSICNFPVVDSIVFPDKWFQMTVSQEHHVKHALVKRILDQVSKDDVRLYFVVPPDVYDVIKWQPIINLDGKRTDIKSMPLFMKRVSQYALLLPLGVSDASMSHLKRVRVAGADRGKGAAVAPAAAGEGASGVRTRKMAAVAAELKAEGVAASAPKKRKGAAGAAKQEVAPSMGVGAASRPASTSRR